MEIPKIGIGAVIINEKRDSVLLLLRKKNPEKGTWSIPGGKVELYESLEEAVIREVKEETNLDVKKMVLLNTAETIQKEKEEHWISVIYQCEVENYQFLLMEPDKAEDIQWFSIHELPEHIACFSKEALELLIKTK